MRSTIRRVVRRARRFSEDVVLSLSPRRIALEDLTPVPLEFTVHSAVERYRIETYGGEREVLRRFLSALREGDIVFDIGASVGLFAIASAATLDRGQVYAFEPDPQTRHRLQANIHLNRLENVHVIPWAVSDREGEAVLFTEGPSGYAATLTHHDRQGAPRGEVSVRTRTLDQAITTGDLPAPSVVKVDIEGAEGLCLRGAQDLLQGKFGGRPREIFLEIHPELLTSYQDAAPEIQAQLKRLGYEPAWSMERAAQVQIHYVDPDAVR